MNTLGELFGSDVKVKLIRLFLFNEKSVFFLEEIVKRIKAPVKQIKKDILSLIKSDILKKNITITKDIEVENGKSKKIKKLKGPSYSLNERYPYLQALKNLLIISSITPDESLLRRFSNHGRIKLFVVSGIFLQNFDSRADLFIVGDDLDNRKIESVISNIESELGKEINYSIMNVSDFEYRMGIHDKLVRDVFDYDHITLLDRLGIEYK
jgi:hypothetical protein